MNIAVFNEAKTKKYSIRYIASYKHVLEGSFQIQTETGESIWITDQQFFDILDHGVQKLRVENECRPDSEIS